MRYTGSLAKKEREGIFRLFLERHKMKFSEMEKLLKLRSNMLAYHIEQMQKEGLLQKQGESYSLTREGEKFIPLFSHVTGRELGPVPVILIAAVRRDKMLLLQRTKRPYKDYWGFIGGKMLLHESVADACARKLSENGVQGSLEKLCAITQERVLEGEAVKHNFLLFLVKAKVDAVDEGDRVRWFTKRDLHKAKVIPSDLWLISKLSETIPLRSVTMQENAGEVSDFRAA